MNFTELAGAMEDRQEVILNIKKIGDDLVIMVTPDLKKKGTVVQLTGSPEDMDLNFMEQFKKPVKTKTEFSTEVVSTDKEAKPKTVKASITGKKKSAKKAAPKKEAKKAVVKKAAVKKSAPKKPEVKPTPKPEVKKVDPAIEEKKQQEEAAAAKLKADKASFDELMVTGKKHYDEREWQQSEAAFKLAIALFPGDTKANLALANASKWVRAVEKLNAQ